MTYLIVEHALEILESGEKVEMVNIHSIVNTEEEAKKKVEELNDKAYRYPYYTYEENKYGIGEE